MERPRILQVMGSLARRGLHEARTVRTTLERRLRLDRALAAFPTPRRLHLGCGSIRLNGWVNVDNFRGPAVDVRWDLRCGVPGDDGSAEYIFCEHFLEHLGPEDGIAFLRECRRVLAPGGTVRIAMPSLDHILELTCAGRWREQRWLTEHTVTPVRTRAEMLNMVFRWWGHQWVYDREELERRLREAGFQTLSFRERGASNIEALRNLEWRDDSLLVCEATRS